MKQGHLTANPAAEVKLLRNKEVAEPLHPLQGDEIARLLEAAAEPWRTLYFVATTGLRGGELLTLGWSDLDCAGACCMFAAVSAASARAAAPPSAKGRSRPRHSRRTIDPSPATVEALLAHPVPSATSCSACRPAGPSTRTMWPGPGSATWPLAGLADHPFHCTRHTRTSLLIAAGVHPKAMQARLGHASITTLNTYGHLMPSAFERRGSAGRPAACRRKVRQTKGKQPRTKHEGESYPEAGTRVLTGFPLVGPGGFEPPTS